MEASYTAHQEQVPLRLQLLSQFLQDRVSTANVGEPIPLLTAGSIYLMSQQEKT